jgi:tRNA pseudouridine(55) synthase
MQRYVVLEKTVGETPLSYMEAWRKTRPDLAVVPLAYAGRLDPMASGKLLVLIGDECKRQATYHGLDKRYVVEVLIGVKSDSGDVLGIVTTRPPTVHEENWRIILKTLRGSITLPYPAYSSKTIGGVPLHTLAVTGQLPKELPVRTSRIYSLTLHDQHTLTRHEVAERARANIARLPTVTDERKAAGRDFRRAEVLASWEAFLNAGQTTDIFTVLRIAFICSSGTYMRSLAEAIGHAAGTTALAFSINRTDIGRYWPVYENFGLWYKRF